VPTDLAPGLYIQEDLGQPARTALRTDIAAFVGIAERGPVDRPTPIASWEQFQSTFGGFITSAYLAYAVKAFFENGGAMCHIVRVAAPAAFTQTDGAQMQPADRSASLVMSVAGFAAGAVVSVRQGLVEKDHLLENVTPPDRLTWTRSLEADFVIGDPARPLDFATGAAAAASDVLDANDVRALRIEAGSPGGWANGLGVRIVASQPAATQTSTDLQPADRSSSIVESTAGFQRGSLVRIFQAGAPVAQYRVVAAVEIVARRVRWDTPLNPYNLALPLSFETLEIGIGVYVRGRLREQHSGLSLAPTHPRYVGRLNAGSPDGLVPSSQLIRVIDLRAGGPPNYLHVPGAAFLKRPSAEKPSAVILVGGRDGTAALNYEDFSGPSETTERRGLRSLEDVDDVSVVAIPDLLIQPAEPLELAPVALPEPDPCALDAPPSPDAEPYVPRLQEAAPTIELEQVFAVQRSLVEHCERQKDRVALLDPPLTPRGVLDLGQIRAWRERFDSSFAALLYPWILVHDPLRTGGRVVRPLPPSGHVAGLIARIDRREGPHRAPANEELQWAQGVTVDVSAGMQGALNPLGINCIRSFPGRGLRLYGARTLSSDPLWRYLNVRRLLLMIEQALRRSLQWAVHEPNDVNLRETITLSISTLLRGLWHQGALVGGTPSQAFRVKCDAETNSLASTAEGRLLAEVKVAPVRPAEFVVLHIGRTRDELEVIE